MKKLISIILSFAILAALPLTSFASDIQEEPQVRIYDFDGNLVEDPDLDNLWKYGAVFNADGTIDEEATNAIQAMSTDYVNASKTLAAGKYWQSYQYQVEWGKFLTGDGTCTKSGVQVEQYYAATVGGERDFVKSSFLTSTETGANKYDGNMDGYVNFIYRNTSSGSRDFTIHIYVN